VTNQSASSAASTGAAVPTAPRTVAAFDFDGTLTRGGSVLPFLVALRGFWPVLRTVAALSPGLLRSALVGGTAADEAKEKLFTRLLGGLPVQVVEERSVIFAEHHLARRLRQDARLRLEWHRRQGHHVVIVSASPECYVRHAGELLGVDAVLGTRLAVGGGGLLTGGYEGQNCRGAEKYARLVVHLRAHGLLGGGDDQPELWAYGNSRGDLRLLRAADHGVDAGLLGPVGRLRRFPRLAEVVRETAARAQLEVAAMPTTRPE
jgi:phosphatidylglycerophosphatase C